MRAPSAGPFAFFRRLFVRTPAPARRSDQPVPFAEPVEGPVEGDAVAWLDSDYFEEWAKQMEAEARPELFDG